jgi:hypothetical protein
MVSTPLRMTSIACAIITIPAMPMLQRRADETTRTLTDHGAYQSKQHPYAAFGRRRTRERQSNNRAHGKAHDTCTAQSP